MGISTDRFMTGGTLTLLLYKDPKETLENQTDFILGVKIGADGSENTDHNILDGPCLYKLINIQNGTHFKTPEQSTF